MGNEYIFVSCDIISHSAESSLERQRDNVAAINHIVEQELHQSPENRIIWASGGDGGHIAYPIQSNLSRVIQLICELRLWSIQSCVNLRITANSGNAEAIQGADGRTQLVGPGINLAGRLLPFGDQSRIIVTSDFLQHFCLENNEQFCIHDQRNLKPTNLPDVNVFLLSSKDQFQSTWDTKVSPTDRKILELSIKTKDTFEVIYRSKRLLDINPYEKSAIDALRSLSRMRMNQDSSFIYDLIFDESFGLDVVRASTLVERRFGEIICESGDHGTTMFLILKGQIGVIFPKSMKNPEFHFPPPDVIMNSGELAGELAFALNRPRTATLFCLEETAFLAFGADELQAKIRNTKSGLECIGILNRKLLSRIIENIWNTADYFRDNQSPAFLSKLESPWLTLLAHTEIESIKFRNSRINISEYSIDFEGLCILVSGRLQSIDKTRIVDGINYPILIANFQDDELNFQETEYILLGDIKLLKIAKEGFLELGPDSYYKIVEQVTRHLTRIGTSFPAPSFDVFLSHNSKNKKEVRELGEALKSRGITVWLDEWELQPGCLWQDELEMIVRNCKSALILVGRDGLGPWERVEMLACLNEFVDRKLKLIPVLLPDASEEPKLPTFLNQLKWVDLRAGITDDAISRLIWGITGVRP